MNPQAQELNEIIKKENSMMYDMLSDRGKEIFFPKKGILGQTAEAKNCRINATIGAALEDDNTTMCLPCLESQVNINKSEAFPYAPSFGLPALRSQWKNMITRKNPSLQGKSISTPVVSSALTHGLSMAAYLFINETDTILVPDMFWGNYRLIFERMYKTNIQTFNTFTPEGGFDCDALADALEKSTDRKKILLLNFPNNPTGYTPTNDEAHKIKSVIDKAAEKNKIITLIDDAYFGLVYENDIMNESIFSLLCDTHSNVLAIKLDGPTKEDYVWGFRIGFIRVSGCGIFNKAGIHIGLLNHICAG